MAYCTAEQVKEIIRPLLDGGENNEAIENHIARADSVIDSKLSVIYTVPFSTTPAIITTISTLLGSYYTAMSLFIRDSQNKNDWVEQLKTDAMEMLQAILDGEMTVIDSSGDELATSGDRVWSNRSEYIPIFDVDGEESQQVDSDLLDEISDDRD